MPVESITIAKSTSSDGQDPGKHPVWLGSRKSRISPFGKSVRVLKGNVVGKSSELLAYGSYAYVRVCDKKKAERISNLEDNLIMLGGDAKRLFIRNEFEILKSLNSSLPVVVRVHGGTHFQIRVDSLVFVCRNFYQINVDELATKARRAQGSNNNGPQGWDSNQRRVYQ